MSFVWLQLEPGVRLPFELLQPIMLDLEKFAIWNIATCYVNSELLGKTRMQQCDQVYFWNYMTLIVAVAEALSWWFQYLRQMLIICYRFPTFSSCSLLWICVLRYWHRLLTTCGGWFLWDFSFYGNKIFQSTFIGILSPGASLFTSLLWTLLNSGRSLLLLNSHGEMTFVHMSSVHIFTEYTSTRVTLSEPDSQNKSKCRTCLLYLLSSSMFVTWHLFPWQTIDYLPRLSYPESQSQSPSWCIMLYIYQRCMHSSLAFRLVPHFRQWFLMEYINCHCSSHSLVVLQALH